MQVLAATADPAQRHTWRGKPPPGMLFGIRFEAVPDLALVAVGQRKESLRRLERWDWTVWKARSKGYVWAELASVTQVLCPMDVGERKGTLVAVPPDGMLCL